MNIIKIKKIVRKNPLVRIFADFFYLLFTAQLSQPHKSFGSENPDKTFLVIRPPIAKTGLLNLYLLVIGQIYYAEQKGYIPVVDFENYETVYSLDKTFLGTKNVWEYFFEPVTAYTLEEVYNSKKVVLCRKRLRNTDNSVLIKNNRKMLNELSRISNEYIVLNRHSNYYINKVRDELIRKNEKILGVFCRGTDYIKLSPPGHPIQPTFEELIEASKKCMQQWSCDKILLTTEDMSAVKAFKEAFLEKVIIPKQSFVEDWNIASAMLIEEYKTKLFDNKYMSGLEYLTSVVLLSECDCFLGAIAGGSYGAIVLNNEKYEKIKILYRGLY